MPPTATRTALPLDERSLTVNVVLAVWTGVVAGAIVAMGGFDEPRPIDNGYVRLATLGLTSMLLAMAFHTPRASSARRMQLGVTLSLIAHTALVAGLAVMDLSMIQLTPQVNAAPLKVVEEAAPELVVIDREQLDETPDFERPVASAAPQMQAELVTLEREAPKQIDTMIQPTEAPSAPDPRPEAAPIDKPRASLAQADIASGRRSRNFAASASIAPTPIEIDSGLLAIEEEQPSPQEKPQPARMMERESVAMLAPSIAAPAPSAPQAPDSQAMTAEMDRAAPSVAPQPVLAPRAAAASSRPRMLAQLGSAPTEMLNPQPNPAEANNLAQRNNERANEGMIALAPAPIAAARSAPPTVTFDPSLLRPAPPSPSTMPAPIGAARPERLAMRGAGLAPLLAPMTEADPRGRSRSAPLASLGSAGRALEAPAALSGAGSGTPGRNANIDAPLGAGGLGVKPAEAAGMTRLQPNRDATASLSPGRFRNQPSGGASSIAGDQRQPTAAFSSRGKRREQLESGSQGAPSPRTEAAIELGLQFLSNVQRSDGSWAFDSLAGAEVEAAEVAQAKADGAATGLALLSFLGAGYDHVEGRYKENVSRGIEFLVRHQTADGLLFPEANDDSPWQVARFYSHGIASIALCEAYGMTGDPRLREPAQRALDYIARTQVDGRGGWRYTPGVNADLSVTGWMLMALRSGELAGLNVSTRTYSGVRQMLESCRERAGDQSRFCYNPEAPPNDPRTSHGRNPGTVMTSVGLLMQLYLGEGRESPRMRRGADHLLANLPSVGDSLQPARTSTLGNPLRDTYYWYYGTQVMFHMGGPHWDAWNDALHPLLVGSQTTRGPLAGSWNPLRPTPDKWRHLGGRLYVTTLNLLSLEVYYRHLPLYEMTGK